ncbi:uncharacterized protein [Lepisosteus oculatus]|uniref:uncharacterized protein isoform X2 n=1 Tax=Lepisosteus oculatus TaxID=7918 RepID=UPI0037228125
MQVKVFYAFILYDMPVYCAAINCSELRNEDTLRRGISFHGFPKNRLRRNQWRLAVLRQTTDNKLWEPTKFSVLCSKHFREEMFDRTGQTVRLRDHAVPTEFVFGVRKGSAEDESSLDMPSSCVAVNCSEERSQDTLNRGITFHRFPKDPVRRRQWRAAIRRQTPDKRLWEPTKSSVICSKHFTPDTFDRTGQTVRLRAAAVPSLFDFASKRKRGEEGEEEQQDGKEEQPRCRCRDRRRRKQPRGAKTPAPSTPDGASSIGDLVLAAELMEVVTDTVRAVQLGIRVQRGFENDHGNYSLPSDPAVLSSLVRTLAQDQHRQEQALLNLKVAMENRDKLFQKKKQWEWELHMATAARDARIEALEDQLAQLRAEGAATQRELRQARAEASASAEAMLSLGTQLRERRHRSQVGTLAACALRGSPKWLRFYTGFDSYARFLAFLHFLQSGDGSGLCWQQPCLPEEGGGQGAGAGAPEGYLEVTTPASECSNFGGDLTQVSDAEAPADLWTAAGAAQADGEGEAREPLRRTEGGAPNLLSAEDQLLLVLARLRLGLLLQDLAFRFRVAESTVSRIWVHWMELMQKRLQQIPVKCSQRYISFFRPKHTLILGDGLTLTVLECADLLFEVPSRDRQRGGGSDRAGEGPPDLVSQPYRALCPRRGCVLASPAGYLGFASAVRLEEWEALGAEDLLPSQALPPYLFDEAPAPALPPGRPSREVLSVRSLTDKALNFRYLRAVHPLSTAAQLDRAWEVCCYLACLLHEPMGLR